MALVEYLVARDGPPPRRGLAYDYLLAGDGLYVATNNPHLAVRVPVARATVRGLPSLHPCFALRRGRLSQGLWGQIVAAARARPERELLLAVSAEPSGYQLLRPAQVAGRLRVVYRPLADVLLEIHSHGAYPACFSRTDDADEQGFGLYGVIGRLGTERSEVALRVGVYGYFLPVPWEAVFEGDRGPFRDVHFDPPAGTDGDGVPD
jgi:PRTRC genetic system protein A